MPLYKIEQVEVYAKTYHVEANTEAEAIVKVFDGEVAPVANAPEPADLCDERGICAADQPQLVEQLREAGIMSDQSVIPSITGIEKLQPKPETQPDCSCGGELPSVG